MQETRVTARQVCEETTATVLPPSSMPPLGCTHAIEFAVAGVGTPSVSITGWVSMPGCRQGVVQAHFDNPAGPLRADAAYNVPCLWVVAAELGSATSGSVGEH